MTVHADLNPERLLAYDERTRCRGTEGLGLPHETPDPFAMNPFAMNPFDMNRLDLCRRADAALHEAKAAGRNRTCCAAPEGAPPPRAAPCGVEG